VLGEVPRDFVGGEQLLADDDNFLAQLLKPLLPSYFLLLLGNLYVFEFVELEGGAQDGRESESWFHLLVGQCLHVPFV
jgi:hypothetical protein